MTPVVSSLPDVPLSVLDLSPVSEGNTVGETLRNTLDLARAAERLGYHRYWLAEHHNMPGIASSATVVLIGHVADATERIRVGSGGIMLPNHAPLVVAEQFGTLEAFHPGRIDLGIGRAPGTDQRTALALRGPGGLSAENFPEHLQELIGYFTHSEARGVNAVVAEGNQPPVWLLGSSGFSAQLVTGSLPGARPMPRSIRPGCAASSRANCSATTRGAWLGSMTPPEPTRIRSVAPATIAIRTAGLVAATAGMLWCSATQ